jgi:hypothetical protein
MEHSQTPDTEASARCVNSCGKAADLPIDAPAVLRRRNEPQSLLSIGPSAAAGVVAFNRVLANRDSEVLLTWPQRLDGIAALHALAALDLLEDCDSRALATLFFPWNRNSGSSQRQMLVDRDFIYRATLPALNRIGNKDSSHPAYGYVIALHSLKHVLTSGRKSTRLTEALKGDPGLEHPTLFEIMPQHGIQNTTLYRYDDQFLRRLQRYTWITQRKAYVDAATEPRRTPFFLFGVDTDALNPDSFCASGLDPQRGGRLPDIVLIDMTSRAQNRLNRNWQQPLKRFLDIALELYLDDCPPVLAVTDDVFTFQILRHEILREYDRWRSPNIRGPGKRVRAGAILTPKPDFLDHEVILAAAPPEVTAEVYGSDILRVVEIGLQLRRLLLDAGDSDIADAVTTAIKVIQNLIGLPGQPRQFHEFVAENCEGYELHRVGARFDDQAPRGKITAALKKGLAGSSHNLLSQFLDGFNELSRVADADNPGRSRFDSCIRGLVCAGARSMVVFSSQVQRGFAEWRIESDPALDDVRPSLGHKLVLLDRREVIVELDRCGQEDERFQKIVLIEPRPEDVLHVLSRPRLPARVIVLANLARTEQTLRRIRILLSIDGIELVKDKLIAVQREFERALGGHTINLGDLDEEMQPSLFGTLDLTGTGGPGAGAVRIIQTSGNLQIKAFDGTEFAVYDADALQMFSRGLAKDLRPGDQICVFSPEFVSMAREKLHLTTNASDVLTLYHRAVVEAAQKLPGSDIVAKTGALRERMIEIDPRLSLPVSMRQWIEVAALVDAPRSAVRPQAPRYRSHYLCFMKALGISDDVARHYWDFGIFWTRSMRIRTGASFHQVFMGILIDPHGTASRLHEEHRHEIWRIYEAAEDHVVTVVSNEPWGGR